ncbi:putative uncharacterized protein [Parachlamydia acanthamoebae UV-7]|uniref:Uncharacterized protein n=2 Tax=Parachlamydia acanthamoebae TaxID=83552 RepID=F8L0M7_PARAV|nr:hypothetical protein [Parachlamydia acanthamoebae]CCB86777.1 putative uncharacterized protein [Parachlamydia acanthamoebae UV-7]
MVLPQDFVWLFLNQKRIRAIISQNENAYEEGLGDAWAPIRRYWETSINTNRDALREFLELEAIRRQYTYGVPDPIQVAPESYILDDALLQRPGNVDIQLDLFLNYAENIKLYPQFQTYFPTSSSYLGEK